MDQPIDVSNQGERILETDNPRMVSSHRERYHLIRRYIKPGDRVLDCATGTGYGAAMLAKHCESVDAVDLSETAISYAREHYRVSNLRFQVGSAYQLPFGDSTFDLFCSIETIEHVDKPDQLVKEAIRVLKPGGLFVVSTPNRVISNLKSNERPANPFHLFEWSLLEMRNFLAGYFSEVTYWGQRVRSRNKFHLPYIHSKLNRWVKRPDFVSVSSQDSIAQAMETWDCWQPENFIAVCKKN